MKKQLVIGILGLFTCRDLQAQARFQLDTYSAAPNPQITYGAGWFGIAQGTPVSGPHNSSTPYTVGVYWVAGDMLSSVPNYVPGDPFVELPTNWGFALATGLGSTTVMGQGAEAGWFFASTDCVLPTVSSQATFIVALFDGPSFETSFHRHLSAPFVLTLAQGADFAPTVGSAMPAFQIQDIPEPSTFALAGFGLASLLIFRRRK
jgi:hypothetical protein